MTDLERLAISGCRIIGACDGTFRIADHGEAGATDAELLLVRDGDDLEIVDAIAWPRDRRSPWWTMHGLVALLGDQELRAAWWDQRPVRLLETPRDWLHAHGDGACIVDWEADLREMFGDATAVTCATAALAARVRQTLQAQAAPAFAVMVNCGRLAA
jgi:hypothetical protein